MKSIINKDNINEFIGLHNCTCTFFQLKARGFKPVIHHSSCPMSEKNPYKEEWVNENDRERYNRV